MKFIDLTNKKFHKLLVVQHMGKNKYDKHVYRCLCDCGKECLVIAGHLRSGNTKSCGCYNIESIIKRNTTHLMTKSSEYKSWYHMKERCGNENNKDYKHYGERGIKVCDDWEHSFENFLRDMGKKPSPKHSLDRIDVNGNYCKENCRWATVRIQTINIRLKSNNTSGYTGVFWDTSSKKWLARIGKKRLGLFVDKDDAVKAREKAFEEEKASWNATYSKS